MEKPEGNLFVEEYHPCCLVSERRCKSRTLRPLISVLHMMAWLFPSGEGERAGCLGRVPGSHLAGNAPFSGTVPPPKSLEDDTFIQGSGRRIALKDNQVYLPCSVSPTRGAPCLKVQAQGQALDAVRPDLTETTKHCRSVADGRSMCSMRTLWRRGPLWSPQVPGLHPRTL